MSEIASARHLEGLFELRSSDETIGLPFLAALGTRQLMPSEALNEKRRRAWSPASLVGRLSMPRSQESSGAPQSRMPGMRGRALEVVPN